LIYARIVAVRRDYCEYKYKQNLVSV
jgi:hypothetical protein